MKNQLFQSMFNGVFSFAFQLFVDPRFTKYNT